MSCRKGRSRPRRSPTSPQRTASPNPSPSSETGPMGGHLEGLHHMLFVSPTIEVGALYDRPVSFEPGSHQRVAANHLQVCNVLWPEKFVVSQLARNEDAILLDGLA